MNEQTDQQQQHVQQEQQQQLPANEGKKKPISILEHSPQAAQAVITRDEIDRMIDLGLGRGVDATNPTPWLNKTAFQVRNVYFENVIGTEEGGALQSYERETTSVYVQQSELKASVDVPQAPISIGVEAEQSRSYNTTRRAVGKKVVNRTISFRAVFDDVPLLRGLDPEKVQKVPPAFGKRYTDPKGQGLSEPDADAHRKLTFEEQLAQWIQERLLIRREIKPGSRPEQQQHDTRDDISPVRSKPEQQHDTRSPVTKLSELIHGATEEDLKELVRTCHDFVDHFRITHYVSAIELGASEYRVMSQSEYYSRIGAGGTFGVEALANAAVATKSTSTWKKTKRASELKRVGRIHNETVQRGSYDEAVVGVDIQPITNLVKLPYLHLALRTAILDYMDEQGHTTGEPPLSRVHKHTHHCLALPTSPTAVFHTQ